MTSPTEKGRSPGGKSPLMTVDAEVCDAKPRATVGMPAAPSSTPRSNPSSMRDEAAKSPATPAEGDAAEDHGALGVLAPEQPRQPVAGQAAQR